MNAYSVLEVMPTATRAEIREAYRRLARRWHPDRFAEGPERDWANEKMAEINAAYRDCLQAPGEQPDAEAAARALRRVEELIASNQLSPARRMLMSFATRSAEWNYLFGEMLIKCKEYSKASIYLSVAAHQNPGEPKYARALERVRQRPGILRSGLLNRVLKLR